MYYIDNIYYISTLSMMYSGHLGVQYTSLSAQTLVPKNHISSFLFSVVFQHKIC